MNSNEKKVHVACSVCRFAQFKLLRGTTVAKKKCRSVESALYTLVDVLKIIIIINFFSIKLIILSETLFKIPT